MRSTSSAGNECELTRDLGIKPRRFERLSASLDVDLWVHEEYLLPFPFAGNKWVKLVGQYADGVSGRAYLSNGGISSNHCRTVALWAAFNGHRCHLVLHNDKGEVNQVALDFFSTLGATYVVVNSSEIADSLSTSATDLQDQGFEPVVIPGGGHSPESIRAYADYASKILDGTDYDVIFHASGTGGTQAGLCIANYEAGADTAIVGVSVARGAARGRVVVQEAIRETSGLELEVDFRDGFVDGGYGPGGASTKVAVATAGSGGLPLDLTYTGKAFAGLIEAVRTGEIAPASKILFWHTGGTYLMANPGLRNDAGN